MNKSDLVSKVASSANIFKTDAERIVNTVFEAITESLKEGEDVRLVGFGTFEVVNRPATQGRNPRTGAPLEIAACRLPKFRPGKSLKDSLN